LANEGGNKDILFAKNFLKFTAQKIQRDLIKNHPRVLSHFFVDAADRKYQFWERNPLPLKSGRRKF